MDEAVKARAEELVRPTKPSDKFVLHMQHELVLIHLRLNAWSCRPASRSTSTRRRHARCPK